MRDAVGWVVPPALMGWYIWGFCEDTSLVVGRIVVLIETRA